MSDVSFIFDIEKGHNDIQVLDGDIKLANELQTSVEMSMFSNQRALINPDPQVTETIAVLQGWWADAVEAEALGSLFWTYQRSKQTQEVLNGVKESFENALQWLIDDGVVSDLNITTAWRANSIMDITVQLFMIDGTKNNFEYKFAWDSVEITE